MEHFISPGLNNRRYRYWPINIAYYRLANYFTSKEKAIIADYTGNDGLIGKNLAEMLPNSCRPQSMCEITRMSPHEDVIRPRLNVSVPSPNF